MGTRALIVVRFPDDRVVTTAYYNMDGYPSEVVRGIRECEKTGRYSLHDQADRWWTDYLYELSQRDGEMWLKISNCSGSQIYYDGPVKDCDGEKVEEYIREMD
jgi:hypothetical protein